MKAVIGNEYTNVTEIVLKNHSLTCRWVLTSLNVGQKTFPRENMHVWGVGFENISGAPEPLLF